MKVDEKKLKQDLEELYRWTWKEGKKRLEQIDVDEEKTDEQEEYENEIYLAGKYHGMNEAISTIMLEMYGGKYCYELWQSMIEEIYKEDIQKEKSRA